MVFFLFALLGNGKKRQYFCAQLTIPDDQVISGTKVTLLDAELIYPQCNLRIDKRNKFRNGKNRNPSVVSENCKGNNGIYQADSETRKQVKNPVLCGQ